MFEEHGVGLAPRPPPTRHDKSCPDLTNAETSKGEGNLPKAAEQAGQSTAKRTPARLSKHNTLLGGLLPRRGEWLRAAPCAFTGRELMKARELRFPPLPP